MPYEKKPFAQRTFWNLCHSRKTPNRTEPSSMLLVTHFAFPAMKKSKWLLWKSSTGTIILFSCLCVNFMILGLSAHLWSILERSAMPCHYIAISGLLKRKLMCWMAVNELNISAPLLHQLFRFLWAASPRQGVRIILFWQSSRLNGENWFNFGWAVKLRGALCKMNLILST